MIHDQQYNTTILSCISLSIIPAHDLSFQTMANIFLKPKNEAFPGVEKIADHGTNGPRNFFRSPERMKRRKEKG